MLLALTFALLTLPLLLAVVAVGLRLSAALGARLDGAAGAHEPLASVAVLRPASPPAVQDPGEDERLPRPGPLQLVDAPGPSTRRCPGCDAAALASARACRRCGVRLDPPERGSWAV